MVSIIPERWEQCRFASIFIENSLKNIDLKTVHALQFFFGNIVPKKEYELTQDLKNTLTKYTLVKPGDIMLNGLNLNYDFVTQRVACVKENGIITSAYISLRPRDGFNSEYYCYYLKSLDSKKVFNGMGSGIRQTLSFPLLKNTILPVPPFDEQDQIVRYLDWQLSKINKLISTKKKEITVLNEKRQKTIDDAVLGECTLDNEQPWGILLPDGWNIVKFNGYFSFKKGLSITKKDLTEEGIDVISYGQVHSKLNSGTEIADELIRFVSESYLKTATNTLVKKGDFIFADTSEDFDGVGNCVYVDREDVILAGYHTLIAHPKNGEPNRYLAYLFKSSLWRYCLRKRVNGVKVYSITQRILKNAFVLIPPRNRQHEIVEFLDERCRLVTAAIEKITDEIKVLDELKNKLISDVVTGQIDVRDIEVPEFVYIEEIEDSSDEDEETDDESVDEEV